MEKGWSTAHGNGTWRVWEFPLEGWYWQVRFTTGISTRGPYKTRVGAERAGWNCIKRWEHDQEKAALWRAHGR